MRSDKLRRRLAVGLLAIAAGVVVVGGTTTATTDEFDWGSAPTATSVDQAPDSGTARVESFSFEFDWG